MTLFWPMKKVIVKIKLFCVIFVQTGSSYWQIWCHLPNAFVPFNTAPSVWRPLWLCLKPSSSTDLEAFQTLPDIIWNLHANKTAHETFHERTSNAITISPFPLDPDTFNAHRNRLEMTLFDERSDHPWSSPILYSFDTRDVGHRHDHYTGLLLPGEDCFHRTPKSHE